MGEPFDLKKDIWAIGIILVGSTVIVLFAHKGSDDYTLDDLKRLLKLPPAILFEVVTVVVTILSIISFVMLLLTLNRFSKFLEQRE